MCIKCRMVQGIAITSNLTAYQKIKCFSSAPLLTSVLPCLSTAGLRCFLASALCYSCSLLPPISLPSITTLQFIITWVLCSMLFCLLSLLRCNDLCNDNLYSSLNPRAYDNVRNMIDSQTLLVE